MFRNGAGAGLKETVLCRALVEPNCSYRSPSCVIFLSYASFSLCFILLSVVFFSSHKAEGGVSVSLYFPHVRLDTITVYNVL